MMQTSLWRVLSLDSWVHSSLHTRQKKGQGSDNHQPISVNIAAQTHPVKASSQIYLQVVLNGTTQDPIDCRVAVAIGIPYYECHLFVDSK